MKSLLIFALIAISLQACTPFIVNQHSLTEQGPGPLLNGQCEGIHDNPVSGAVTCIIPDAEDPNKIMIGTTNGGIWKIDNAITFQASWRPVSDNLPSMSISSITRGDFSGQVYYASVARTSSFLRLGGPLVGIMKSIDGGENWSVLSSDLNNIPVFDVEHAFYNPGYAPTAENGEYINLGNGLGTTYAATDRGLFITYDESNFNLAPQIPASLVTDIISVGKGNEFYVAIPGDSVYFSNDFGQTFKGLNIDVKNAENIKLALTDEFLIVAQADTANLNTMCRVDVVNRLDLITVVINNEGPYTLEDFGSSRVGPFTSDQKQFHFSLTTFQREDGSVEIFIGGVLNKATFFGSTGQSDYSGRIFMGVLDPNNNIIWKHIVGNGAHNTAPHADSRAMAIDADGNLLQACDGGIYKFLRTNPETSNIRKWISINHDLRISEVTRVAWDAQNDAIIAGLQDNGSAEQITSAFGAEPKIWSDAKLATFFGFTFQNAVGDGYAVNVDNQHSPPIRYIMLNHFTDLYKREYNEINPPFVAPWNRYGFNYNCFFNNCALHENDKNEVSIDTNTGVFPFELNVVNPSKFVIGGFAIYEFKERGDQMYVVDSSQTTTLTSAIAYGHPANEEMLYYAKLSDLVIKQRPNSESEIITKQVFTTPTSIPDMAIDIDNPENLFVVTSARTLLKIENFSSDEMTVTNLNFQPFETTSAPTLLNTVNSFKVTIEGEERSVLLVGCLGGVYVFNNQFDTNSWLKIADNFPNVIITDVKYYKEDDILVIGTLGRGVWTMEEFSSKIPELDR